MKRIMSTLTAITLTMAAQADDYTLLTMEKTDGTRQSVSVENLVITFADGQMKVENTLPTFQQCTFPTTPRHRRSR